MTARLPDCQVLHSGAIGTLGAGELYLFMYIVSQFPYISPTIASCLFYPSQLQITAGLLLSDKPCGPLILTPLKHNQNHLPYYKRPSRTEAMDESLMERIAYERRKEANANEKPSKGRPPRARPWKKRACKACTSCRARKVRCDVVPLGNPPCSNCKHDEIECCLPPPRKRRRCVSNFQHPAIKSFPGEIV